MKGVHCPTCSKYLEKCPTCEGGPPPYQAALSFDLTNFGGRSAFEDAVDGNKLRRVLQELCEEMGRVYRGKVEVGVWVQQWEATDLMRVEIEGVNDDLVREVSFAWRRRLAALCADYGVEID